MFPVVYQTFCGDYSCGSPGAGGAFARQAFASQSEIHIKENHIEIGEKIEIKPELENHEHVKVRDTAPISSIGSMVAGVQEAQDLAKEIRQFKEAAIKDASPEVKESVAEDFEEKFVEEAKLLVAKADKVKKAIEEKKPEAQETHTVQLKTYDDIVDECIDAYFASQSTDPRDSVISAQTNSDAEDLVRKATLLRYDLEDFIAKYPNAAEWCAKIFVGATYVLQGVEYVVAFGAAGPAGVGAKYATQEGISTGVEHGIEAASNASAAVLTKDPILQTEYSQTFKCFSYIGMCLGSVKPAKQLVKALKHGSVARSNVTKHGVNINKTGAIIVNCNVDDIPNQMLSYTWHGWERVLSRDGVGVSVKSIHDTISNPKKIKFIADDRGGSYRFIGETSIVVLNGKGALISAWAKSAKLGGRVCKDTK